jgi:transposase
MASFVDYPFKGRKSCLDQKQKSWLQQELKKNATPSLSKACRLVEEHTGVHYGASGMHYVFKCLGVKKKTGRSSHVDQQPEQAEVFKEKTLPN